MMRLLKTFCIWILIIGGALIYRAWPPIGPPYVPLKIDTFTELSRQPEIYVQSCSTDSVNAIVISCVMPQPLQTGDLVVIQYSIVGDERTQHQTMTRMEVFEFEPPIARGVVQ